VLLFEIGLGEELGQMALHCTSAFLMRVVPYIWKIVKITEQVAPSFFLDIT